MPRASSSTAWSSRSPAPRLPLARSSPSQITRRAPTWPGPSMTVATATGSPARIAAVTSPSSGNGLRADRLHEHVQDPAAGQPHGERVVVADPVGLQHGLPGLADLPGHLVHGTLDAAAGHAAGHLAIGRHRHRGARLPWRAAERPDDGGQAEHLSRVPPLRDRVQDVSQPVHLGTCSWSGPGQSALHGRSGPAGALPQGTFTLRLSAMTEITSGDHRRRRPRR